LPTASSCALCYCGSAKVLCPRSSLASCSLSNLRLVGSLERSCTCCSDGPPARSCRQQYLGRYRLHFLRKTPDGILCQLSVSLHLCILLLSFDKLALLLVLNSLPVGLSLLPIRRSRDPGRCIARSGTLYHDIVKASSELLFSQLPWIVLFLVKKPILSRSDPQLARRRRRKRYLKCQKLSPCYAGVVDPRLSAPCYSASLRLTFRAEHSCASGSDDTVGLS
jgi:hypothetical protein